MSLLQVEEQHPVETSSTNKSPRFLYLVLVVTTIYFILSLYFNFSMCSRLESVQAGQWAAIEKLKQRQSQLESELKASNGTLAERLAVTEQDLQWDLQKQTEELKRQHQVAKRLRNRAEQQQNQLGAGQQSGF